LATTRIHKPSLLLSIPNLGLNTNLAPNPVSASIFVPPANAERQTTRDDHEIAAKAVRARFTTPRQGALSAGGIPQRSHHRLLQLLNNPAGPTKRTKHANSKAFPQQLPSRLPIPHTTTTQVRGLHILDLSSCRINFRSDYLDVTTSETTALKYKRVRTCRFTPTTYQPKGPEPPQLTSLCAHPTRETPSPFSTAQRDTTDTPATLSPSIRTTRVRATKQATAFIPHSTRVTASATRQ
jgi:hypothetical protein